MAIFDKKKKEEELSDVPDLPPLDLSQVPTGPPISGAPKRLEAAETAQLTPAAPPTIPPQMPPAPAPPAYQPAPIPYSQPQAPAAPVRDHVALMTEDVEKIAEDIVDEKWTKLVGELNEIKNWKDTVVSQIDEIKQNYSKLDKKIDDVQKIIIAKVNDYNKSISDVNVELKAMAKVFEKVLPTFTDNVKKLGVITSRARTLKPKAATKTIVTTTKVTKPKKGRAKTTVTKTTRTRKTHRK